MTAASDNLAVRPRDCIWRRPMQQFSSKMRDRMHRTGKRTAISAPLAIAMVLTAASGVSAQLADDGTNGMAINNDITRPIHRLDYFLE